MIQIKAEHETYLEIYSDKLIYEPSINKYWETSEESPIAVDKGRFANGDYVESDRDVKDEILENIENLVDNNE